jgi:hypothetical protein
VGAGAARSMVGLPHGNGRGLRLIPTSRAAAIIAPLALLASCADLPRDPAGTTERVRQSDTIMLGVVEGTPPSPEGEAVLARVAQRLGARASRQTAPGEELLEKLHAGHLDLVYGHFAMNSPWSTNVHFGSPLGPRETVGKEERLPRFAFQHGENGWIMRVEREIGP